MLEVCLHPKCFTIGLLKPARPHVCYYEGWSRFILMQVSTSSIISEALTESKLQKVI